MRIVYRFIWILSALAIVGMTYVFATQPMALPMPGPMKRYTVGDHSLRILHPGNWKAITRSAHGVETQVEFDPAPNARMTVTLDLAGSLMADVMKAADSPASQLSSMIPGGEALLKDRKSPMEQLHEAEGKSLKKNKAEYPGFADGATRKLQISGREALITECTWQAEGLFGKRPVVGRRVTMLSGDHHVMVVYGCLKEMEPVVLPVFYKMLGSLEIDPLGGGQ